MPEDETLKENIRKSFFKVKEDIEDLKSNTTTQKEKIREIESNLIELSEKVDKLTPNLENNNKNNFFNSSTGNKGVVNSQQSTVNNSQQSSTMPNNTQQSKTQYNIKKDIRENLEKINSTLTFKFKSLTDRELSIFLAIYDLEIEKNEVSYADIANKLNLTESTIRTNVYRLIQKELPIEKERFFNKKVILSISNDFRNLNLINKILELRKPNTTQKTLFEI